jgi:hypothetical protein
MKPWRLRLVERVQPLRWARRLPALVFGTASHDDFPRRGRLGERAVLLGTVLRLATVSLSSACVPHEEQQLSCDDVYAPGEFDYATMESLIMLSEPLTSKGCLGDVCHSAGTQRGGVRLDTRDLIYEELSTRPALYYETLATGYMPHDGIRWEEEDLKVFRSWYCAGAFPP